ncbi:MAG: aminotransferase class V-fold PLP-dependent enzyme [Gemmatimonadaceae bacterium]|nr:aminotransferase class V-fold PLP-dependent enzyme [Gemmatimonadaceae bacterium]
MRIETLAVHAGHGVDPSTGAVAPPIHLSTTFEREPDGSYREGLVYTRTANPNRGQLERAVAALEGGGAAAAFASGSAAIHAVIQALDPGAHVIAPKDCYHGTLRLLRELFARWGVETTFVDMCNHHEVERAVRPATRLVWVETPSNPLVRVFDIRWLAGLAHAHGARCAVDNTWATPVATRPLALGADLVMHSSTKYFGGHSDVLGGIVVARAEDDELFARVREMQTTGGSVPSPFDCWLTLRGVMTLPWRFRAQSANAAHVAEFLAAHPRVTAVHYPGLPSHPQHALAATQMEHPGAMLSIEVRGTGANAMAAAGAVQLFTRATSLGGVESLIEHRASVEGPETHAPDTLLRLSIGLEHPDDLVADLDQALGGAR